MGLPEALILSSVQKSAGTDKGNGRKPFFKAGHGCYQKNHRKFTPLGHGMDGSKPELCLQVSHRFMDRGLVCQLLGRRHSAYSTHVAR